MIVLLPTVQTSKTMASLTRLPKRSTSRRLLPGHALASRYAGETTLPGVDPSERRARRHSWTRYRAEQRARFGRRDALGLAGAALVLALMISTALTPRANVLDASMDTTTPATVQMVDAAPSPSPNAARLEG